MIHTCFPQGYSLIACLNPSLRGVYSRESLHAEVMPKVTLMPNSDCSFTTTGLAEEGRGSLLHIGVRSMARSVFKKPVFLFFSFFSFFYFFFMGDRCVSYIHRRLISKTQLRFQLSQNSGLGLYVESFLIVFNLLFFFSFVAVEIICARGNILFTDSESHREIFIHSMLQWLHLQLIYESGCVYIYLYASRDKIISERLKRQGE